MFWEGIGTKGHINFKNYLKPTLEAISNLKQTKT
jgi:hypothetical protein